MTDAQAYLDEIVGPTIEDFRKEPTSRRRAFLACVALFHTVDYLAAQRGSPNSKNLRKQLRKGNPDFAIVDRMAHAFKHSKSGSAASPDNKPLRAQEVFSRPPAFWGVAQWDISRWGDTVGGVEIENERELDLLDLVDRAFEFVSTLVQGEAADRRPPPG
jgi:hypothetical protein